MRNPWAPRETVREPSEALPLLHLLHESGQFVDHLLELFATPLHRTDLVTHAHEHVVHLGRCVRRVLFGAAVTVPLFHMDSPRDFTRADALTEREYAVRIVLSGGTSSLRTATSHATRIDESVCFTSNFWNGSSHNSNTFLP